MQVNYENDEREAYKKASRRVKEIKDFIPTLFPIVV